MPDRRPKFQVGDLVRHRASGTLAVVSEIHGGCKFHGLNFTRCGQDCTRDFLGSYTLNREFGDSFSCGELVLEMHENRSPLTTVSTAREGDGSC